MTPSTGRASRPGPRLLLLGLLAAYLLLAAFRLTMWPLYWIDEAWFMNPAYELSAHGRLGTTLFGPWCNFETHTYVQPPLHLVLLAACFELYGFGLETGRWLSILVGGALVALIFLLARRMGGALAAGVASCLLITHERFLFCCRTVRMDVTAAFFMAAALLVSPAFGSGRVFWCGVFSGLSALAHPNGLLVILLLGVLVLSDGPRRLRRTARFALGVLVAVAPYLAYVAMDVTAFWAQLQALILNRLAADDALWGRLVGEAGRLALIGPLAGLFCAAVPILLKVGPRGARRLLLVLGSLVLLMAGIVPNKSPLYLVLLLPPMAVLVGAAAGHARAALAARFGSFRGAVVCSVPVLLVALWQVRGLSERVGFFEQPVVSKPSDFWTAVADEIPRGSVIAADGKLWPGLRENRTLDVRLFLELDQNRLAPAIEPLMRAQGIEIVAADLTAAASISAERAHELGDLLGRFGRWVCGVRAPRHGFVEIYHLDWDQEATRAYGVNEWPAAPEWRSVNGATATQVRSPGSEESVTVLEGPKGAAAEVLFRPRQHPPQWVLRATSAGGRVESGHPRGPMLESERALPRFVPQVIREYVFSYACQPSRGRAEVSLTRLRDHARLWRAEHGAETTRNELHHVSFFLAEFDEVYALRVAFLEPGELVFGAQALRRAGWSLTGRR